MMHAQIPKSEIRVRRLKIPFREPKTEAEPLFRWCFIRPDMNVTENKMRVTIASPPDGQKLVGKVFFEDEQWPELNQESGVPKIEIYPRRNGQPCTFRLDEAVLTLEVAKTRLTGVHDCNHKKSRYQSFRLSIFGFLSDFGLRVSDFVNNF
jgi:hypothetical protein